MKGIETVAPNLVRRSYFAPHFSIFSPRNQTATVEKNRRVTSSRKFMVDFMDDLVRLAEPDLTEN